MSRSALRISAAAGVGGVVVCTALAVCFLRPESPATPSGSFLARPDVFVLDIPRVEDASDAIGKSVKKLLLNPLKGRNPSAASAAFHPEFLARFPAPDSAPGFLEAGLRFREYGETAGPDLDAGAFLSTVAKHLEGWAVIERASWRAFETLLTPDSTSAFVSAHLQLGGSTHSGTRGDLQGVVEAQVVSDGVEWKLRRLSWKYGTRIDSEVLPFADISAATGLTWNFSDENQLVLQQLIDQRGPNTVGGISAVDWNRDGHWDLIATLADKTAVLFENDGRGGFERRPLPFATAHECGNVALMADLDRDGLDEIVTGQVLSAESSRGRIGVYTRRSGQWELLPGALEFDLPPGVRGLLPQAVVPGDINGDGLVEIFVGIYSHAGSRQDRFSNIEAYDGADDLLFVNHGNLSFTEESDARGIHSTQFTLAAAFFDLDADGDQDLIQVNDYGPNVVWENSGSGTFRRDKTHPFVRDPGYNMGVCIADFDNSGKWSVHFSDMYSHAGNRILRLGGGLGPELLRKALVLAGGNRMFESVPGTPGGWTDVGNDRGIAYADWAWSCNFFDFDNDGDRDLFVTNGFTSHTNPASPDY
ncbi:MAG: aspic/unbv domain [Planctomycetota bacterium]|nr:MAG: aspic/unbv domain [Planctomycetota bacterium]